MHLMKYTTRNANILDHSVVAYGGSLTQSINQSISTRRRRATTQIDYLTTMMDEGNNNTNQCWNNSFWPFSPFFLTFSSIDGREVMMMPHHHYYITIYI